ncbi:MAG TPA: PAS domain S-box protein [Gaiellaceae bacterium]
MATPRSPNDLVGPVLLGDGAEYAEVAITVYDDDGRYIAANRKATELLGYSREELLKHDVADFTEGGIDRTVLLYPSLREGARIVTRNDGTKVPVAYVVAPTRVSGIQFYFAVWWRLPDDDPRALAAK